MPLLVGDDVLAGAIVERDYQLGQQLRRGAVVRASPLGIEAEEACIPSVGEDRAVWPACMCAGVWGVTRIRVMSRAVLVAVGKRLSAAIACRWDGILEC
jgi:hypothetical protein